MRRVQHKKGETQRRLPELLPYTSVSERVEVCEGCMFLIIKRLAKTGSQISRNFNTYSMSRRIEPYSSGESSGIIYHAEEGKHSATVVIMHGLGDSADGMASIADLFYVSMPHVKWILPTAKQRPVTMNMVFFLSIFLFIIQTPPYSYSLPSP